MSEFDPMAVSGARGKMAAAGDDDIAVTISGGGVSVDTTLGAVKRAAEKTSANGVARDQLQAFVDRIERLEEEKATIADDIKGVYGEAKSMGFDAKILRRVISIRKKDANEWREEETILDTYLAALGMLPDA